MNSDPHRSPFLGDQAAVFEAYLTAFEEAWKAGQQPNLDDFLPAEGPHRLAVLEELIATDLEYRFHRGQMLPLEAYLARYPELAAVPEAVASLRGVEAELAAIVQTAPMAIAAASPGNSRLGRFELREIVGRGSCGVVYRAWDPLRGCEVALKTPLGGRMLDPEARQRLMREARNARRLAHPGLVPLLEAGEVEGVPYLVSPFIAGPTLARWAKEHLPGPLQAAELVLHLARAVNWAHERGIIHRDIKPSNILIDSSQQPHLTDFGLAKCAGDATLTASGQIVGTLAYMSPEQADGQRRAVDRRSDVYSLGAVLYELLSGRPPFQGIAQAILKQIALDDPPPPQNAVGTVPAGLGQICLKAMAKEPAQRYATAGAFADDLMRWLSGHATSARPKGLVQRLIVWGQRRPAIAALAAALVLALGLGMAGITLQWRRAEAALHVVQQERNTVRQQRKWAEQNLCQARQHLATAQRILKEMDALCQRARMGNVGTPGLRKEMRKLTLRYHELLLDTASAGTRPGQEAALAMARVSLAREAISEESWDEAEEQIRSALATLQQLTTEYPHHAGYRHDLARTLYQHSRMVWARGDLPGSYNRLQQALAIWESLAREFPPQSEWLGYMRLSCMHLATTLRSMAQQQDRPEWLIEARDWFQRGLELCAAIEGGAASHKPRLEMEYYLGQIEEDLDHREAARFYYQRSIAVYEAHAEDAAPPPDDARLAAAAYHNLGRVLVDLGRPEEAIPWYGKALALREELQRREPDNPTYTSDLGGTLVRLGLAHQRLRETPEAMACFTRASQVVRGLLERYPGRHDDRFRLAQAFRCRGQLWEDSGAWQAALRDYESAAAELQKVLAQAPRRDLGAFAEDLATDQRRVRLRLQQTSAPLAPADLAHRARIVTTTD